MTLKSLVSSVTAREVGEQSFNFTPGNWTAYAEIPALLRSAGYTATQIEQGFSLSRADITRAFSTATNAAAVVLGPIWGYPGGVVGPGNRNPLRSVIRHSADIAEKLRELKGLGIGAGSLAVNDIVSRLIYPDIGLSTLSKVLYFSGLQSQEGTLLIYDQMVMRALHHHCFDEYGPWPAYRQDSQRKTFDRFISLSASAASSLGCRPDQIEYALFREGQRLGSRQSKREVAYPKKAAAMRTQVVRDGAQCPTLGGRSFFTFYFNEAGDLVLRFGKTGKVTVSAAKLAALIAHFQGQTVPLTATHGPSLADWVERNVTKIRITSYLAPVLILRGFATRDDNRLRFGNAQ